jgi:hypothetical protein
MPVPSDPPEASAPHIAVSLHFKKFEHAPGFLWHQEQRRWYDLSDLDTLIELYRDRVSGWFLDCVRQVQHNGGFIMVMVAISYLEKNERYREGDKTGDDAGKFFKQALRRVFPELSKENAKLFYEAVRCGLFHEGMTRRSVSISEDLPSALKADGRGIVMNPRRFLDAVVADLESYVRRLRDPGERDLRDNFREVFINHDTSPSHKRKEHRR